MHSLSVSAGRKYVISSEAEGAVEKSSEAKPYKHNTIRLSLKKGKAYFLLFYKKL